MSEKFIARGGPADVSRIVKTVLDFKLQTIDLTRLNLAELPETVCDLTQLRVLKLSNNRLTKLPNAISRLTQLQELHLDNNELTELPEALGQLTQLKRLELHSNQLTELPGTFGQLSKLWFLSLTNNKLEEWPECLNLLPSLQKLYFIANNIKRLPDSFGQLTQLIELFLDRNQLTDIPDSTGRLGSLQVLGLENNNLTNLSEVLKELKELKDIYLHGNEALGLPPEIIGDSIYNRTTRASTSTSASDILEYYFRVRASRRPLNEAKLILVGRGAVGKTSLVSQLVRGQFEQDQKKTEGIQITEWKIYLNNEEVRLNIWDFGGQEIMHATHQFFLTHRSLYLLVLNGREGGEDSDAEYWLKYIESFGGDSPAIIVMNKIKEHPFDVNRRALQQKYPFIRDFIKTDCKSGDGITELLKAIEREADRLEHLRDAFPSSWFTIKDRLAGMRRNFLSFDEYRKLCAKLGEKDPSAQESLAFCLHSLGIALNYKDDPRLQDMHVLNPHWVTNGIYKILNSEILERQKGEIGLRDLSGILATRRYPTKMHRFLLDLMKKFELCFSFPDDDTHYLIPELLDKQEPPEAGEFNPEECLNFQYHYSVLPEGLLPRFIVRTKTLSEDLPRWRTGVILRFEGNKALVKADMQDKKAFISVSGPAPGRRRLLAVIRSDFERIHNDIRNMKPQEMVPVPDHPDVVVSYDDLLLWEAMGRQTYSVRAVGRILDLNVHELLNGVDLEGTRRRESTVDNQKSKVRLFYSYSHKDEGLRNELEIHLKLLQRKGLIETWHDRRIEAGHDWKQEIDENLERADIVLLLVSANFIASDYAYEKEMRRALERHESGATRVVPVIIRDVNWGSAPFARLQALPKDGKPVTRWANKDSAWRNVSEEIEKVIGSM